MFKNYLKIAFRNIWRNKFLSFLNISGLAFGIACSTLIFLWVRHEISYDQFHSDQVYRVMVNQHWNDLTTSDVTPSPLADALKEEIPEIDVAVRTTWDMGMLLKTGDISVKETGRYAGEAFFSMFSFKLLDGDPTNVLSDPSSIVISKSLATKIFHDENPIGNTITVNNEEDFIVTGIMEDIPVNSSLKFDFVLPQAAFEKSRPWLKEWGNSSLRTFVKLRSGVQPEDVNLKIKDFLENKNPEAKSELFIQPVQDMYLHSNFKDGQQAGGRIEYVRLFAIISIFIILIACINFMNLATARSAKRAKEVGIRKVIGAGRQYLIGQFTGEAVTISLLAMLVAILIIEIVLPHFNLIANTSLRFDYTDITTISMVVGISLAMGLLSGIYPSLYLSSLQPSKVLKGLFKTGNQGLFFRQSLVVFQFVLSILLIIGTLVVYYQIDYIKNKNLGLNRENVLVMPIEGEMSKHYEMFITEASAIPGVKSMTIAFPSPLDVNLETGDVVWPEKSPEDLVSFSILATEYDFTETMGIEILEGRDFSEDFRSDTAAVLINETAAKAMGFEQPLGQNLSLWEESVTIIGVVKDYHNKSLHEPISPQIIVMYPGFAESILIKTDADKTSDILAGLQTLSLKINPDHPFHYDFLDDTFHNRYKSEMTVSKLAGSFTLIAIIISCLGLFGLSAFTAEQRTKEIGIRKTLGGSVAHIVGLLSRDFVKLVLLAMILAIPLSWYFMQKWLQNFTYKIELEWWLFVFAGSLAVIIAIVTISYQSIKAALANPVDSLRSE